MITLELSIEEKDGRMKTSCKAVDNGVTRLEAATAAAISRKIRSYIQGEPAKPDEAPEGEK